MSRNRKAAYYDDEDLEDYEEEEEEYYDDYNYDNNNKFKSNSNTLTTPTTVSTMDSNGLDKSWFDYDLINSYYSAVRAAVGPMVPIVSIVAALRDSNYDLSAAIEKTRKKPTSTTISISGSKSTKSPLSEVGTPSSTTNLERNGPKVFPKTKQICCPVDPSLYLTSPTVPDVSGLESITIVIAGHVDSGKSTILGHLLVQLNHFKQQYINKIESNAKEMNKLSFKYAWLLDQSEEERRRGVTIDSGSQSFCTSTKRVNILDAPGHMDFVMNMISSSSQADAAMLVISAQPGEFESGLEVGTKTHITILKAIGIKRVIIAINKMDKVSFKKERYDEVVSALQPKLAEVGYKESGGEDGIFIYYIPISGLNGVNLIKNDGKVPWYKGPSLVEYIDNIKVEDRLNDAPLRLTVHDVTTQGSRIYGRVETGTLKKGSTIVFIPSKVQVRVQSIDIQPSITVAAANAGTLVEVKTNDITQGIKAGDVGCPINNLIECSNQFEAFICTYGAKKALMPGTEVQIAIHSKIVSATIIRLLSCTNLDGKSHKGMIKCISPGCQGNVVFRITNPLALELAENVLSLGTFIISLDDEVLGKGEIKKILPLSS